MEKRFARALRRHRKNFRPSHSGENSDSLFTFPGKRRPEARGRAESLGPLLQQIAEEGRKLNGVNVATILHSAAKRGPRVLTAPVLQHLAKQLRVPGIVFKNREIGNSLSGLYVKYTWGFSL